MIPVDKNVPIPGKVIYRQKIHHLKKSRLYPFDRMEIGDSFVVPPGKKGSVDVRMNEVMKRTGQIFTRRMADGVMRVWRIR